MSHACTIKIDPSGNATIFTEGEISVHAKKNIKLNTDKSLIIVAKNEVSITAQRMSINAPTSILGGLSVAGSLSNNSVNVGSGHAHSGVKAGADNSGPPVGGGGGGSSGSNVIQGGYF